MRSIETKIKEVRADRERYEGVHPRNVLLKSLLDEINAYCDLMGC